MQYNSCNVIHECNVMNSMLWIQYYEFNAINEMLGMKYYECNTMNVLYAK